MRSIPFAVALACTGMAHADTLYKCTDADGHATYTNSKGTAKNCVVISRDQPVSIGAAPKASRSNANAPTPGDFPKVGAGEQKTRDGDRRAILDQELATEQKSLEEAKKTLAQQEASLGAAAGANPARLQERIKPYIDTVQLHERNIEALKKELANLK
jgi:multidrug resistance efflux pump